MTARRLHYRNAFARNMLAEVGHRSEAVLQVVFMQNLFQPDRDCFQVAAGQPSVGGEALGQDQQARP
jgi:hypothetical protein